MSETVSVRRSQTREKLVEAAIGVFADKGVLAATVEEISEAAGFTRGAFYSNFDSKDALCLAVLEYQTAQHLAATRAAIASLAVSGDSGLDTLVDRAVAVALGRQDGGRSAILATIELRLYAVRSESLRPAYLAAMAESGVEVITLIEQTAAAHGLKLTVPGHQVLSVLQAVYESGALSAMLTETPDAPDRADLLVGVLKSMLVPR